jgi:hypothetical protein
LPVAIRLHHSVVYGEERASVQSADALRSR